MSIRCDLSVPVDFAGTDFFKPKTFEKNHIKELPHKWNLL